VGQEHEVAGIDLLLWSSPQQGGSAFMERADPTRYVDRQNLVQLGHSGDRRLLQAGDAAINGTAQSDDDRRRLIVVKEQRGEASAAAELVAPESAGHRFDRITQVPESFDVAPDGSLGDIETSC
jgi:hypothetical protein